MNRRRRARIRRLMRAMPHESTVDRREHAMHIENEVQRAKVRGAAHKRMILLSIIVAALGVITLVLLLLVMWPVRQETLDELEVRRRQHPRTGRVDRVDEEGSA